MSLLDDQPDFGENFSGGVRKQIEALEDYKSAIEKILERLKRSELLEEDFEMLRETMFDLLNGMDSHGVDEKNFPRSEVNNLFNFLHSLRKWMLQISTHVFIKDNEVLKNKIDKIYHDSGEILRMIVPVKKANQEG